MGLSSYSTYFLFSHPLVGGEREEEEDKLFPTSVGKTVDGSEEREEERRKKCGGSPTSPQLSSARRAPRSPTERRPT